MGFTSLIPWAEADARRDQQRSDQYRDAQRQQTIAQYMSTANQITRQLGYVDNLHKALALVTDPNTHQIVPGHEEEAARLQDQLKQYNVDALHGNLNQVQSYIQRLYDPNFNLETGMPGRSPIQALGEKLHLTKPQTEQRKTAGEMMKDLRGIQQKYDIAAPGIETGEQELAGEEAQREQLRQREQDIEFTQKEAAKYLPGDKEGQQAILEAKLGGYRPTAPKAAKVKQIYQATDGKQYVEFDNGEIKTLGGDAVSPDVLNQLQLTPLSRSGAANLKLGTLAYFLNSAYGPTPTPQQQAEGRRIWQESAAIERQTDGTIRVTDANGNMWEIPETRISKPVPSGLTPPAPYQPPPVQGAIQIGAGGQTFKGQQGAGAPVVQSFTPPGGVPQITPGAASATGATDVTTAPQAPIAGGGGGRPAPAAGATPTPPVPGARFLGKGKDTPPQVKARENFNGVVGLQAQAAKVSENLRRGLPVAVEQHRIVISLERLAAGRFTQQAANYMVQAGLANRVDQAISQLTGGGELPANVWQQVLRAIDDQRAGAEEEMKSAGLDVPKTAEEQQVEDVFQRLNKALEQENKK